MLNTYLTRTQQLLQNPQAPNSLYATSDLQSYINQARGQLSGEAECIRVQGTLALVQGQRVYNFSSISIGTPSSTGVQGVINARQVLRSVASGYTWMRPRPFEWLTFYRLNNPAPVQGPPNEWSQYGQGAAPVPSQQTSGGSIYVDPVPDQAYSLQIDCVCYPLTLASDSDPEAIPFLWTDAVPYFAAYLALLSAQSQARQADAERMFNRYTEFVNRSRRFSTPSVLPTIYPQNPSPVRANQLGIKTAAGGGG
jgi:hypothetical protein